MKSKESNTLVASSVRVPYAYPCYGAEEVQAVVEVLGDPTTITAGRRVKAFEKAVAKRFGKAHGVMVNSGSSANLLAFEVLKLPPGSEVITPALTFSTTLAPILQKGLTPVFVDVDPRTYVVRVEDVRAAITPRTRALIIPLLLGNVPDMRGLSALAKKHKLFFIEDSCDTLGARFAGKPTGAYSHITTTSFYATHVITAAGSGGMVCFKDAALARRALVVSTWGRQSSLFGSHEQSEDLEKRFSGVIGGQPYDAKFIFSEIGYNFQSTDLNAAFGLVQLRNLPRLRRARRRVFAELMRFFARYDTFFELPRELPTVVTTWMHFPVVLKPRASFTRLEFARYLEERHVQTRPIFTGTVTRQPAFSHLAKSGRKYPAADYLMKHGILLGCHPGMTPERLRHLETTVAAFVRQYGVR